MKQTHPKASWAATIIRGVRTFPDLESRISSLPSEEERGDAFEVFVEALVSAETVPLHKFEAALFFEACLPIEELARRPTLSEIDVSRLRGETMLAAKELRLAPPRERLAAGLQRLTEALRRHDQTLARPVSIAGQPAAAVAALLREHAERTRSCSGRVEAVIA